MAFEPFVAFEPFEFNAARRPVTSAHSVTSALNSFPFPLRSSDALCFLCVRPPLPNAERRRTYPTFNRRSAMIRDSVGGWLANRFRIERPAKGSMMNRLFWAGLG